MQRGAGRRLYKTKITLNSCRAFNHFELAFRSYQCTRTSLEVPIHSHIENKLFKTFEISKVNAEVNSIHSYKLTDEEIVVGDRIISLFYK